MNKITLEAPGYDSLADVLRRAFEQASGGKGKERHATDLPFDQQPMQTLASLYGPGFLLGQAAKKSQESQRLPAGRDVAELLGAINYLAGAVIFLESKRHAEHHAELKAHEAANAEAWAAEEAASGEPEWIEWAGGENPAPGKSVQVRLRNGTTGVSRSNDFEWPHGPERFNDIVAYRVIHG
jgi:hypothetical protein